MVARRSLAMWRARCQHETGCAGWSRSRWPPAWVCADAARKAEHAVEFVNRTIRFDAEVGLGDADIIDQTSLSGISALRCDAHTGLRDITLYKAYAVLVRGRGVIYGV